MGRSKLMKGDFEKDVVYLVQVPRAGCLPSVSPFALKLETWLRMAGIRYQNVDNKFTENSSKEQIPFVELNGRELNDTNFIIDELTNYFGCGSMESHLSAEQRGHLHSYLRMTEESLRWVVVVDVSKNAAFFMSDQDGMGRSMSKPYKLLLHVVGLRFFKRNAKATVFKQGYGRFSEQEINHIAKGDLKALDDLIGNQRFFFGDKPTRLDASVFGVVGQLLYTPMVNDTSKRFIQSDCPNLNAFMARVKATYWPDWDEILTTRSLNTSYIEQLQKKQQSNTDQNATRF